MAHRTHSSFALCTLNVFLASLTLVACAVQAAPYQQPLLSSLGSRPQPNIMLTLDTSGSMNFRHMPEGSAKVGAYAISMPSGVTWLMHPLDDYAASTNYAGYVGADIDSTDVSQLKMRSPDVNSMYYNPEVRYLPWRDPSTGGRYPQASFTKAFLDPKKQTTNDAALNLTTQSFCIEYNWRGQCSNLVSNYNVGIYYRLRSGSDPSQSGNYTLYNLNSSTNSYTKHAARTDCAGSTCTQAEERANFANWWVYYRTRMLLTKAALSESFADMGNVARVGWTTIYYAENNSTGRGNDKVYQPVMQGVRPLTTTHRADLLTAIQNFNASGGTPLRIALDRVASIYFRSDEPWRDDPTASGSRESACRRSYNILTTDGYYNDSISSAGMAVGDYDGSDQTNYIAARPYTDKARKTGDDFAAGYLNTLADFALKWWATDLRPNTTNSVTANAADPATWQHLTQFTVGLGVTGSLNPETDLEKLKKIADSDPETEDGIDWPDPASSDPAKIDDMWHAAVNSRGAFYSAKDAMELAYAIGNAIGIAGEREQREAGVITTVSTIQAGNRIYVPEFNSGIWSGDVRAYSLQTNGRRSEQPVWKANDALPAASARNLVIWNPNASTGASFLWDSIGATNQGAMTSGSANLVNYLRGDTTNEGAEVGKLRVRPRASESSSYPALPDFVNSNPIIVKGHVNLGYSALPATQGGDATGSTPYQTFLTAKAGRAPVLFVGGNGGFLHAFDDLQSGREIFGFMPRGVLGNLHKLAAQSYGLSGGGNEHHFFVDGPLVESDVYLSNTWRNILVGALGAGGKGLYALKLDTNDVRSNLGATSILWDLTATTDRDVGYIYADAQVGVLPNGEWKVFSGNGFSSTDGKAVLLMVGLTSSSPTIEKVEADTSGSNGLGGVALVKNTQQQVVAVYAGDLKGNLWRFDYDSSTQRMVLARGGVPLTRARGPSGNVQSITAAPAMIGLPNGDRMVLFGTGRLFEETDRTNTAARETVYGITDVLSSSAVITRSQLTGHSFGPGIEFAAAGDIPATTRYNIVSDTAAVDAKGWYIDLTIVNGQRMIYPIQQVSTAAFFSTVRPANNAEECVSTSGEGYNFIVEAATGNQFAIPVLDTNGNGEINSVDSAAAGYKTQSDGRDAIITGSDGRFQIQNTRGFQEGQIRTTPTTLTIKDRVWKRLLNAPQPP